MDRDVRFVVHSNECYIITHNNDDFPKSWEQASRTDGPLEHVSRAAHPKGRAGVAGHACTGHKGPGGRAAGEQARGPSGAWTVKGLVSELGVGTLFYG